MTSHLMHSVLFSYEYVPSDTGRITHAVSSFTYEKYTLYTYARTLEQGCEEQDAAICNMKNAQEQV